MINSQLRDYIARVLPAKHIDAEDVRDLQRRVLADGLASRAEAEALLSLDRMVTSDPSWGDVVTSLMVDFVVWGLRPTGKLTAYDVRWLAEILDVGSPTPTALRIAQAVRAEADQGEEGVKQAAGTAARADAQGLAA
jgi:hypothetical protein